MIRCPACGNPVDVGCKPLCPDHDRPSEEELEQAAELYPGGEAA